MSSKKRRFPLSWPLLLTCRYQLFVRPEIACFFSGPGSCWHAMKTLVRRLFHLMASALRERLDLALETMALRHQLAVLERSAKRPSFSPVDRCFWVLLSAVWSRWPAALEIVHADTVRRWRRTGWRILWLRQHRRVGRPPLARKTQELIRWISQQHRLWGAPRLQGELAKLRARSHALQ
jgi:hypothetical protein